MRAIYRNLMNKLGLTVREGHVDMSFVVEKIFEKLLKKARGCLCFFFLTTLKSLPWTGEGRHELKNIVYGVLRKAYRIS